MRKTSVSNAVGSFLLDVFDDEQHFAWLDQAELATRDLLDGGGVFAKAAGRFAQRGIFRAGARERSLERGVFTARFEQGEQSLFTEDRVDDDDESDENKEMTEETASPASQGRLRWGGTRLGLIVFVQGNSQARE